MFEPRPGDLKDDLPFYERMMPRSLRLRLVLPFVLLIGVVLLTLVLVLGNRAEDIYIERLVADLERESRTIAEVISIAAELDGNAVELPGVINDLDMADRRVTVIDADGTVLADTSVDDTASMEDHSGRAEVVAALEDGIGVATRTSATVDEELLYVATRVENDPGTILRIAVPLDDVDVVVDQVRRYLLLAALIALLLAAGLATYIGMRLAGPLEALRHHAQMVAEGDLDSEVAESPILEIDEVGRAFNLMTFRLKTTLDDLDKAGTRLEAVLGGLEDGVVITDSHGEILRLNRAAEGMLAVTESRAVGRPFIQVARDHELDAMLQAALRGERRGPVAVDHGLNRRMLQSSAITVDGKAESLGLVVLRDITDLRRLEGIRREFVANVSHELRTPLTSIRALVETLEAGTVDDPNLTQEFLRRIVREVDRLTALVEDLMDLGRLEAGRAQVRFEEVDTAELLHIAGERLREQVSRAQLDLSYQVPNTLPDVLVDRRRIEQVVINLVHNAIKFTPAGGHIEIGASQHGDQVIVYVKDNGVGIARDEIDRLFERFYKSDKARRSEGTGLGLAIAKHIVQAHGGEISVESEPNKGAIFRFTLLVAESRAARKLRAV